MKVRIVSLALALLGAVPLAIAGGSYERVRLESLTFDGEVDYTLVVRRQSQESRDDPYFSHCERLEVRGTFSSLKGAGLRRYEDLTREAHIRALAYLKKAQNDGLDVNFGWLGTGMVAVEPQNQCIVRSRALRVYADEKSTAVISHHDAF